MTNQGRKISDEELVEIAGGVEQITLTHLNDKPADPLDRSSFDNSPVRPGGGSTIPIEPIGGTNGGNSGMSK